MESDKVAHFRECYEERKEKDGHLRSSQNSAQSFELAPYSITDSTYPNPIWYIIGSFVFIVISFGCCIVAYRNTDDARDQHSHLWILALLLLVPGFYMAFKAYKITKLNANERNLNLR